MFIQRKALVASVSAICLSGILAGCGGGSGGGSSSAPVAPGTPAAPVVPPAPLAALTLSSLEFAQSHVVPATGLAWTTPNDSQTLHLVGGRDTLALVKLGQADVQSPVLEGWRNGARLGTVVLAAPTALALTEAGGARFASDRWSATIPGAWLTPGVSFKVSATNYAVSAEQAPAVGLDADLKLAILPFYLFGANDSNTQPYSVTKAPTLAQQLEMAAKWPVAKLHVESIGPINWPSLVVRPRSDSAGVAQPAYVLTSMDQQKDGYASMSAILGLLDGYRNANGEGPTNNQYYAPLLPIDSGTGKYHSPGGGLGTVGGGTAVGDYSFGGIMFHELGHGFGLHHAADAYADGKYPYVAGSLKGAVWGFDFVGMQFLDTLIPAGARNYANCATSRQLDANGRCIKQDPMQSGNGDQATGQAYTMLADFYAGKIQRWFEGVTTTDTAGVHQFSGGRIFVDAKSATGYSRWDSIAKARVPVSATTTLNKGLYGVINQGLPVQSAVPVHALAITFSKAGTPGITQIYQPLSRTGNLLKLFDPADPQDRAAITPGTGEHSSYCRSSGCDYTVRVRYADGSTIHRVLSGGFRTWLQPTGAMIPESADPKDSDSYRLWVINVPGATAISKLELLDTPMVWAGMPATPTVIASR